MRGSCRKRIIFPPPSPKGLDGALIDADPAAGRTVGAVRSRERLGGLLRDYYRAAA